MTRLALIRSRRAAGDTLAAIGSVLGVSRQRVDQLLRPEARLARKAVERAVRAGRLSRPESCQRCGVCCQPEAHHPDYALRLSVEWLCRACHVSAHVAAKRGAA